MIGFKTSDRVIGRASWAEHEDPSRVWSASERRIGRPEEWDHEEGRKIGFAREEESIKKNT